MKKTKNIFFTRIQKVNLHFSKRAIPMITPYFKSTKNSTLLI